MKCLKLSHKIFCIAALLCGGVWNANANSLVNSGFETGNFAGWTVNDPSGFTGVGNDSAFAHSGDHYAFLGATPNIGSLSQSFLTTAGASYSLSFWLANDVTTGPNLGPFSSFDVFWNGVDIFSLTPSSPAFAYTQFSFAGLVATGGSTTLEFRYRHDNDFFRLDDVAVNIPESFSTLWLALPFAGLGLLHFRSRAGKDLLRA